MYLEDLRFRMYHVLEPDDHGDRLSRRVDRVIMAMILLSVLAVMLETVEPINAAYGYWLQLFELITISVFTVEYVLRLWCAPVNHRYRGGVRGRLRFALTPMAIIDFVAIAPFFVAIFFDIDVHTVLMLRLFRLLRLFKLARYMESLKLVTDVFKSKRDELTMVLTIELFLLVIFSSMMYMAEHEAQPDKFSSIPESMWFGIITMTTVGYGDVSPVTTMGKFAAASLALVGVAMFALPTGIIAAGFSAQMQKKQRVVSPVCPHCGNDPFVPPDDHAPAQGVSPGQIAAVPDAYHGIADGAGSAEPVPQPEPTDA